MNRFEYVLATAQAPEKEPLSRLAVSFSQAVLQNELQGLDATQDPSVLILGAYIAFRTHADVNTLNGYHSLLSACEQCLQSMDVQ